MTEPTIPEPQDFKTIGEARATVLAALDKSDRALRNLRDPRERVEKEHRIGPIKGRAAKFAPDRADLATYALPVPDGLELYCSEALQRAKAHGIDTINRTQTARAHIALQEEAEKHGLDGRAFVARYDLGGPQEAGTAAAWAAQDMVAILRHRGIDPGKADVQAIREASRVLDRLHAQAERSYADAARMDGVPLRDAPTPLRAHQGPGQDDPMVAERLALLGREARAAIENSKDRPATPNEIEAERAFVAAVERQLSRDARAAVEQGRPVAFAHLAPEASRTERAELVLTYLEARRDLADEQTRGQYVAAIRTARTERAAARAADKAAERQVPGRGDDREL